MRYLYAPEPPPACPQCQPRTFEFSRDGLVVLCGMHQDHAEREAKRAKEERAAATWWVT